MGVARFSEIYPGGVLEISLYPRHQQSLPHVFTVISLRFRRSHRVHNNMINGSTQKRRDLQNCVSKCAAEITVPPFPAGNACKIGLDQRWSFKFDISKKKTI